MKSQKDDSRTFEELIKEQERNVLIMIVVAVVAMLLGAYLSLYYMYIYEYRQSRNLEAIRKEILSLESEYEYLNVN